MACLETPHHDDRVLLTRRHHVIIFADLYISKAHFPVQADRRVIGGAYLQPGMAGMVPLGDLLQVEQDAPSQAAATVTGGNTHVHDVRPVFHHGNNTKADDHPLLF